MNELSVAWGYASNTSGYCFWSHNADGRYTVGFYPPTTFMFQRLEHNLGERDFTKALPSAGSIKPSKSDDALFNFRIGSFSKNLAERVPTCKEIMTASQVTQLRNRDLADKLHMSSYVRRVASFIEDTGDRDEYIHTNQPVRILAEAGFFHHSQKVTVPQLICFVCGFETREMRQDPIDEHLRYEESAFSLKFGCESRRKVRNERTVSLLRSVNRPDSPTLIYAGSLQRMSASSHDDEQWQNLTRHQPETGEEENSRVDDEMEEEMMGGWVLDEDEDIDEVLTR